MRAILTTAIAVIALTNLGIRSADHAKSSAARELRHDWSQVGSRLVSSKLYGASADLGLTCFQYRQSPVRATYVAICFTADGYLAETVHLTSERVALTDLLPTPSASPIRVSPVEIKRSIRIASLVIDLRSLAQTMQASATGCMQMAGAATEAARRLLVGKLSPQVGADVVASGAACESAASTLAGTVAKARPYPSLVPVVRELRRIAQEQTSVIGQFGASLSYPPRLREATLRAFVAAQRSLEARVTTFIATERSLEARGRRSLRELPAQIERARLAVIGSR
jgi:hypothetical protein